MIVKGKFKNGFSIKFLSSIPTLENGTALEDMAVLSLCHHSAMTVGSFGFWSSFLAGGTKVYADPTGYKYLPPFSMNIKGFKNFTVLTEEE